ncbi:MAG: hypothetical protein B7Y90_13920 [Alphaproteobacteria bacterium 32-64-14]|nr:MAG: hypothetical protein B7Y90_13920 [Alphaproteobacteria bacterium 32-64-14]
MTSEDYDELGRLADEAFDRAQPATVQKAKLLRYRELLDNAGENPTVDFYWLGDPNAPSKVNPVQDELDHVEWRLKNGR